MTKLSAHHAGQFVKLLYMGNSSVGKTGSLVSLVKAGYQLRILDMDNGLDVLKAYIEQECPDKIDAVDYESRRDTYKATPLGAVVQGVPKAYIDSLKLMTQWSDTTAPSEWGANHIFIIDSLTGLARAAYEWARAMSPGAKEPRTWFYTAQQACENVLSLLTNDKFHANVIVIAHVDFREQQDGTLKGFAKSIGKALGDTIPTYFNNVVLARSSGSGTAVRREIATVSTPMVDLKSSAPFKLDPSLPLGTGLATIFEKLKGTHS